MKKITKRILAIVLSLIMLAGLLTGCASNGKTLMELEGTTMSVNLYKLYLSRMKGMIVSSVGESALKDSFWDTVMSTDGTTYNEYYSESVLDNAKTYLAALYEFEQRGLELSKEKLEEIDKRIEEYIEYDANGSKTEFNAMLAEYGVNYKLLREAYIIEAKIEMLKEDMYGKDGELIADNIINDYYEENYARFKQVFFYTYDYVYETDENGDDIYYNEEGEIVYDTEATPKKDENGNALLDKDGNQIYVKTENGEEKIAYDTMNGKRQNKIDEDGSYIVADITGDRLQSILDKAAEVYAKTEKDNFDEFDKLISSTEEYPNGIYITQSTEYDATEVVDAVFEMEVGEIKLVKSSYGIHIVMRYELEDHGYKKNDNSDFFISTTTGNFVFMNEVKNMLLSEKLAPYKAKIIIDTAVLEGVDIKRIGANMYY